MVNYQDFLISAYSWTATPVRTFQAWRMKAAGQLPIAILFYHRVADTFPNPWTISRRGFLSQLQWLQANFELISLVECQRRIDAGRNERPSVAITFDDGYAENSEFAIPLLLERRIPLTYFVASGHVINQTPFSHDLERNQPLPIDSVESIRALSDVGIEIGCHTVNHADCGKLQKAELRHEIGDSTRALEDITGKAVRYFAFPFGLPSNLSQVAFDVCQEQGFQGVCSAYGGYNAMGEDSFHLQRIHGDPSQARLKNWLSYSPRHLKINRYKYSTIRNEFR